ncbi:MAG: glycosyltransferase family 2 protein [Candidatus Aminicenantes bacterium]|nr:glycosyltransferase family 2 protein [Candidatus Aminicenantes bacterium]
MPERSSSSDPALAALKCSIVIVSFNQIEVLKAAMDALKASPPPFAHEIIVVDNHSAGDVQEFLNDYFHDIRVIRSPANHGFGWANNRGAAAARGEYLLFLNSDAEVIGPAVAAMVNVLEHDRRIGVLGPLLVNSDGSFQLSYGATISLPAEFYQKCLAPLVERLRYARHRGKPFLKATSWVSGACLLTRRELFTAHSPFDENMFLYFEDHDLCLRVRAMGKRVVYFTGAAVKHLRGRSVADAPAVWLEYRKSQLYMYRKYGRDFSLRLLKKYLAWKFGRKLRRLANRSDPRAQEEKRACLQILLLCAKGNS